MNIQHFEFQNTQPWQNDVSNQHEPDWNLSATNRICAKRHFDTANDSDRMSSRDLLMTLCPIVVVFAGLRGRKESANLFTFLVR